ncbi:phosphatase PAP2 family protein [Chryseobacterium sp. CCH4-E10]|uniref:phosphatase PAP2 family protein n=1 Tax=Chryseobacterium sp. CCH4-E10 TaxID=1768758 RepID=UPI001E3069C6|nr:phosphatase PAP2 family protein [Chryseobacterium sp. CCH4-E10]
MKGFPNYNFNNVHIESLYEDEKKLFGFVSNGSIVTPNEYFAVHNNKLFDILSGIFYLSWVTVPIFLTIYFLYTKKSEAIHLPFVFFLVNIIGFILYYIYPAAPPWYVSEYGFQFLKNTPGNAAGLARFDNALGIDLFHSMYEKSSNVFAAMPSLHSAYPVVSLYFALKKRLLTISLIILLTAFGIWFFAVYSSHHYILDVLSGILCAVVGIVLYELLYNKQAKFSKLIDNLCKVVTGN